MTANNRKKNPNNFIKYSNMGFQIGATIFAGVFGGLKLDEWCNTGFPVFTLILSIISFFAAIYIAIKDFL